MLQSVFVVDQTEAMATLVEVTLMQYGIPTFTASDLDCLHFIEDFGPGAVVVELSFPGDQLRAFLGELKGRDTVSQIPVLGLGGPAVIEGLGPEIKGRFQGFLAKPVSIQGLKADIEGLIKDGGSGTGIGPGPSRSEK